jgi:methionyl-tRNA synthetase
MLEQKRELVVPTKPSTTEESAKLISQLDELKEKYISEFEKVNVTEVTKIIVEALDVVNGYIDITEP